MNLMTIDMSEQTQHIEGTHGEGVPSDARVAAEAAFVAGTITQDALDAIPAEIAAPGRELSWAELGRVFAANGSDYETEMANQSADDDSNRLIGYIIKGTAMNGDNDNLIPATISGNIGPNEPWIEWLIEPRENVLQGVLEGTAGNVTLAGVRLSPSTLLGMPATSQAELNDNIGNECTIVGHWAPQVPTLATGSFHCRELELTAADPAAGGVVILGYEGPVTEILSTTAVVDGVLCNQIMVMDTLIHVPSHFEIPGVTANRAGGLFTGADLAELGSRELPTNLLGEESYLPTIGATFAGEARRASGGEIVMDFVLFIELAENVLGSNLEWDTSTDGGADGTGNATASTILPLNARPANPAGQLPSNDPYFSGSYMDVGGEEITISSRATTVGNMNVDHPSALNALLVGHYSHPNNVGSDGNFHIVEGETEYHPAGTVRIIRARGSQDGPSARLDIIGQVKPQLTSGLDGTDTAVYELIPAFVEVDFGSLGRYSVPVIPNVGLGVDGGLIVGGLGGGTGDIGTWRFTLRGDAVDDIDAGDAIIIEQATDTIIPAEMTGSATNVASHTVPMDTRVTVPVL